MGIVIKDLSDKYRHKKTGNVYYKVCSCIECTNHRENLSYIVYQSSDGRLFCREASEFYDKFDKV